MHPERDAVVPIDEGRLLASLIPDCRFVQLDSENHMPLADEPAWPRLVAEMRRFLARAGAAAANDALPLDELTPRERAVLEGIAGGLDNAEIALAGTVGKDGAQSHHARVRQDRRRAPLPGDRAGPRSRPRQAGGQ